MNQETIVKEEIKEEEIKEEAPVVKVREIEEKAKYVMRKDLFIRKDEKVLIEVYRFIRDILTWRFFLGIILGSILTWLLMR